MATTKKYVSLEKLGLYDGKIKGVISTGDANTLQAAKDYADSLETNYDAAGAAAGALTEAKNYADGKDAAIAAAQKAGDDAAAAAGVADGKAVAAQNAADAAQADVDALELLVGTLPEGTTAKDVVDYVNVKTAGIATDAALEELQGQLNGVQGEVATIKGDYLKTADKTALQGNIDTLSQAHATDKAALEASIKAITDDYLKGADKTALQDQITENANAITLLTDGVDAEKVDGVKDLIAYVEEHGTEVTGMKDDIAGNTEAIEGVAGRMTTAEGKITAVEGAVATKAEKTYVDDAIEALEGADTEIKGRLDNLEAAVGESGSVAEDIAAAKGEAIAAAAEDATTKANKALEDAKKYADDEDAKIEARVDALETASGTHALASDLNAVSGRVGTLETDMAQAKTDIDAVEVKAAANETAIGTLNTTVAGKAAQADLEAAVARIAANEAGIAAFVEVSEEEINQLFA